MIRKLINAIVTFCLCYAAGLSALIGVSCMFAGTVYFNFVIIISGFLWMGAANYLAIVADEQMKGNYYG